MRSLQPQTSFGLYNFIVNTSKRVLLLPLSDAYVISFLYLLCTLIKLYYTHFITHRKRKIEGKRRKGRQRLDGITDSMDMSLSKLLEIAKDRGVLVCSSAVAKSWKNSLQT